MFLDSSLYAQHNIKPPEWLIALQNDVALITAQAARQYWAGPTPRSGPYFNYRMEHVQQVEREALNLLTRIPADRDTLLAMVWIHDRAKPQFDGDNHTQTAADWARDHLAELGFPADKVSEVVFGVAHHADPPNSLPANALEARLLWDADTLTRIGPLNIINQLMNQTATRQQRITYTNIALLGLERLDTARRLTNQLYFEASRQLAKDRYNQQKSFFEMLVRDVDA